MKNNYWLHCGYELVKPLGRQQLALSDDFLRKFLRAQELAPIAESCPAELALHEALLAVPSRAVSEQDLSHLQDPDAADNYRVWLRFRARLLARPTLEGCYLALFEGQGVDVPPKFVHQLTQVLLRHVLGDESTAMHARAAEMLFRSQKISVLEDGAVMAADEENVERYATTGGFGSLGELLKKGDMPLRTIDLDVLNADNAAEYFEKEQGNAGLYPVGSERYEWVLNLNRGSAGLQALAEVLEKWIVHFLGVEVSIRVEKQISDPKWLWHVGLDAQASAILNDLYKGLDVDEERLSRLLCLFSLHFKNAADMASEVRGHPVYLAMAMDEHKRLRLKPQNLLLNLPLSRTN